MEKINFDKVYYHGLDVDNCGKKIPNYELSISRLETILKTGSIYSRKKLLESKIAKDNLFRDIINWNGNDYVSITRKNSYPLSAYYMYVKTGMALIIDDNIEKEIEFREDNYLKLTGEIQVKDAILSDYFIGITICIPDDSMNLFDNDLREVESILVKTGLELPVYGLNKDNDDVQIMSKRIL